MTNRIDAGLLLLVLLLVAIGISSIYSAASLDIPDNAGGMVKIKAVLKSYPVKQSMSFFIALLALFVTLSFSYMHINKYSYAIYGAFIVLLMFLFVFGRVSHGSRRWIDLGFYNLQPSEFMKLALVVLLARFMMYKDNLNRLSNLVAPFLLTVCPMGLIVLQPDLGTALLFFPILLVMLLVAGARIMHLVAVIIGGLALAPVAYMYLLKPYQQMRILALINPEDHAMYEGYQLLHSKIAIGTGGAFGKGWGNSLEGFVPESHTDFIFAVICEEWGFVGAMLVLLLYTLLLIKCIQIAYRVREPFGRLLVVGITTYMMIQAYINLGMTVGLAPITGLTLPFLSYGGSSLLLSFVSIGLIMNVAAAQNPSFSSRDFSDFE